MGMLPGFRIRLFISEKNIELNCCSDRLTRTVSPLAIVFVIPGSVLPFKIVPKGNLTEHSFDFIWWNK